MIYLKYQYLRPLFLVDLNIISTVHCTVYAAAYSTRYQQNDVHGRWWGGLCTLAQHNLQNHDSTKLTNRQQTPCSGRCPISPWYQLLLSVLSREQRANYVFCTHKIAAEPGHTSCFSVDIAWLQHVLNACQLSVQRCKDILPLLE